MWFFEHELDELCSLYKEEKRYRISLSDLKGKGIDRSTAYLGKVAGVNTYKDSMEWHEIKNIKKIRNIIVRQNGYFNGRQGNEDKVIIDYIKKTEYLSGENEMVVEKGFLKYVVNTYNKYFQN